MQLEQVSPESCCPFAGLDDEIFQPHLIINLAPSIITETKYQNLIKISCRALSLCVLFLVLNWSICRWRNLCSMCTSINPALTSNHLFLHSLSPFLLHLMAFCEISSFVCAAYTLTLSCIRINHQAYFHISVYPFTFCIHKFPMLQLSPLDSRRS